MNARLLALLEAFKRDVEAGTAKLQAQIGRPVTFGQYAVRIGAAMGVSQYWFENGRNETRRIVTDGATAQAWIDQRVIALLAECKKRAGMDLPPELASLIAA